MSEKRSFKSAFTKRRCLIPADGFYEWSSNGEKRPFLFTMKNEPPFAIAGFWDEAEDINRCCLLTTAGNSLLSPIHNRMPVIVRQEDWQKSFSSGEFHDESFQHITAPYRAEEMNALAVSPLVNNAKYDDPRCCEPASKLVPQKLVVTQRSNVGSTGQQQTLGF